jgi:putative acetyltransferase
VTGELEIRESLPDDHAAIGTLYPDAFPDEDLLPLVRNLLTEEPTVLSLVGLVEGAVVGHVIFTACKIVGTADRVALLGPLAVASVWQRRGFGGALVRDGLQRLKSDRVCQVYVLGDPAYYGRFGFQPDNSVTPPYPLPEGWRGAWQSIGLCGAGKPLCGKLSVPRPWRHQALWAP